MLEHLALGINFAFDWHAIMMIFFGVMWGIVGGFIPGINATVAMSLILPFTWGMQPHVAIMMLLGIYAGAEYAGSIPACLIGTPGTNAAACTVLDGYELTKKGRPGLALGTSLYASVMGGLIGNAALIMLAIPLASVALSFGPSEYCALAIMGLTMICSLGGKNVFKGVLAGVFGIFLSTVGLDPITSVPRFSFGILELNQGFNLIPVMMGLFAVTEVLKQAKECLGGEKFIVASGNISKKLPGWQDFKKILPVSFFSGIIGTFIGVMPGAGASTSSFLAYNEAKRWLKNTHTFGQGDIRGIAAPEAANNAVTGGALVPLLSLGIPGSNSTAIMLGALMIHNVVPGPMIFDKNPEIAYGAFVALFIANIFLLLQGFVLIRVAYKITSISKPLLLAAIITLVFTGAYAVNGQISDIILTVGFGIIGYGMKKFGLPPTATVLGFVLGSIMEHNLRRALIISEGSYWGGIFNSPLSSILIIISILSLVITVYRNWRENRAANSAAA